MAACPSSHDPQSSSLTSSDELSNTVDDLAAPVISVSPHKAAHDADESRDDHSTAAPASDECIAKSLAALIEQAEKVSKSLDELNGHSHDSAAKSAKSSLHLQERLRLSARMLKAFSAQINRVEAAVAQLQGREETLQNLQTQAEKRFAGLSGEQETMLTKFRQNLSAAATSALQWFDEQLAQKLESHARQLADSDPVEKVTQEVRQRINTDMAWLSKAMRDVAERVEQVAGLADQSESRTGPAAAPSTAAIEPKTDRSPIQKEPAPPLRLRTWVGGA